MYGSNKWLAGTEEPLIAARVTASIVIVLLMINVPKMGLTTPRMKRTIGKCFILPPN